MEQAHIEHKPPSQATPTVTVEGDLSQTQSTSALATPSTNAEPLSQSEETQEAAERRTIRTEEEKEDDAIQVAIATSMGQFGKTKSKLGNNRNTKNCRSQLHKHIKTKAQTE